MSIRNIRLRRLFCWGLILLSTAVLGQRQQELEAQRKRLQQEIKQINTLLFQNKKQQKNTLGAAEDLQVRIQVRERLIRVTHEEINWLGKRILNNERDIDRTRKELQQLRDDYEQIIRKSYAARAQQNKLLFIFSSESFLQAYKRIQYLKQYAKGALVVKRCERLARGRKMRHRIDEVDIDGAEIEYSHDGILRNPEKPLGGAEIAPAPTLGQSWDSSRTFHPSQRQR